MWASGVPLFVSIGAYGVAIIVMTIIIRLALAPLQQFQLVRSRRTMAEQRKIAPQLAELQKKFKKDPQKLQAETMKLWKEHGINPSSAPSTSFSETGSRHCTGRGTSGSSPT